MNAPLLLVIFILGIFATLHIILVCKVDGLESKIIGMQIDIDHLRKRLGRIDPK